VTAAGGSRTQQHAVQQQQVQVQLIAAALHAASKWRQHAQQ
jgi:hypothetical protein